MIALKQNHNISLYKNKFLLGRCLAFLRVQNFKFSKRLRSLTLKECYKEKTINYVVFLLNFYKINYKTHYTSDKVQDEFLTVQKDLSIIGWFSISFPICKDVSSSQWCIDLRIIGDRILKWLNGMKWRIVKRVGLGAVRAASTLLF